jgi:hypothetical protein
MVNFCRKGGRPPSKSVTATLALDGSPKSLFPELDTINYFSTFSGLKINSSKTKIVWICSKKISKEVYHRTRWKLKWGCTIFSLLGIEFSVDLKFSCKFLLD